MLALVAAPGTEVGIELREVPEPSPAPHEAVVEVRAVSLNRGEVRALSAARDGARHGWDLAGVVAQPAQDGSGPTAGARVVGLLPSGAWAQRVAVRTSLLAELPEEVSFAAASTLPVAGLTALRILRLGGLILGKRVLVTGAAGGVGRFAVQLAAMAGAHVTGVVGRPERAEGLAALGAQDIVMSFELEGPSFDLILESVGGASLAAAFSRVVPRGVIVTFGSSSAEPTTVDVRAFYRRSGACVYAFALFSELERDPSASADLAHLAGLVAAGRLRPQIDLEMSWRQPGPALAALMGRQVAGKAVLHVD